MIVLVRVWRSSSTRGNSSATGTHKEVYCAIVGLVQVIVVSGRGCEFGWQVPLLTVVHGVKATRMELAASHEQLKETKSSLVVKLHLG